jgi:hypothetical protein
VALNDTNRKAALYSGHEIAIFAGVSFAARFVMRLSEKAN